MVVIRPFRGVRFDPRRVPLSRGLCPPYDVISPVEAARLRGGRDNAVHLELPEGTGAEKYRRARNMVSAMDAAGFGNCTNHYECEAVCPKEISVKWISKMNRDFLKGSLWKRNEDGEIVG